MIPLTDHLYYGSDPDTSPEESAKLALGSFFKNYSLEACQQNLWYFVKYAFCGQLPGLGGEECLDLMTFYEQLNEALIVSHKAYVNKKF